MKKKSKFHQMLVAEGVVDDRPEDPRDTKPVVTTSAPAAEVVAPRPVPSNQAPTPIERAVRKLPQAYGISRAINANIEAQGGKVPTDAAPESKQVTGLQRAIEANIAAQKSK